MQDLSREHSRGLGREQGVPLGRNLPFKTRGGTGALEMARKRMRVGTAFLEGKGTQINNTGLKMMASWLSLEQVAVITAARS